MEVIIERIENEIAIVELPNGKLINVPKELFGDIKENDIVSITINEEKTKIKKEEIKQLMNDVFED